MQKTVDATLKPGEIAVDDYGVPAQSTQVERKVYAPSGTLLSDADVVLELPLRAEDRARRPEEEAEAGYELEDARRRRRSPATPH